tara:strand:- start:57 stop:809 length:753 start_codon:yes stop_codon:yes gene_type:complete
MKKDKELFTNNWERIKATMDKIGFKKGVLIVDNMYTSTDINIQENEELKTFLSYIVSLCNNYDVSLLLGCHNKKGTEIIKDLVSDQIQGGATLRNVVTNCLMIHSSSLSPNLRIAKIVKAGRTGKNELYKKPFKLRWSDETSTFKKGEVIFNLAAHFETPKKSWEYRLLWEVYDSVEMKMRQTFTRDEFRNNVPDEFSEYADPDPNKANNLTRFLNRMKAYGFVDHRGRDKWFFIKSAMEELEVAGAGEK